MSVLGASRVILVTTAGLVALSGAARADNPSQAPEAWRTSPFHGAISGATGEAIPCLCLFRGRSFKLGERVCMQTPRGIVLTRCDMLLNNTTWVPTDEPCTNSQHAPVLRQSRPT